MTKTSTFTAPELVLKKQEEQLDTMKRQLSDKVIIIKEQAEYLIEDIGEYQKIGKIKTISEIREYGPEIFNLMGEAETLESEIKQAVSFINAAKAHLKGVK